MVEKFPKVKSNEFRNIWEAISIKAVVGYHKFRTNLTDIYFVDILKPDLLPDATMQFKQRWRLQQDNDPKTRVVLPKNSSRTTLSELLECWTNSLDLNPIENYWKIIKRRVEKRRKPTNIDEMEQFTKEEIEKTD